MIAAALSALLFLVVIGPVMGGALTKDPVEWNFQSGTEQQPMGFSKNVQIVDLPVYDRDNCPVLQSSEKFLGYGNRFAGNFIDYWTELQRTGSARRHVPVFDLGVFIVTKFRFLATGAKPSDTNNFYVQGGRLARIFNVNLDFERLANNWDTRYWRDAYYAQPSALVELQRGVCLCQLPTRILVGISQSVIKNDISGTGEYDGKYEKPDSDFLTTGALVIVALLLTLGTFKSISYAVDRNKMGFILLAFFLQACGVAAILYIVGVFSPFSH